MEIEEKTNKEFSAEEVLSLLAERRSVREFSDLPVEPALVEKIIRDASQAPSACNHQLWHFVIVSDQDKKQKIQKISGSNKHFTAAPVVIVLCFQKGWNHNKFAVVQSTAAAAYHICLSAHIRGLATVWNAGIGSQLKVADLLGIPPAFEVIGAICLGYEKQTTAKEKAPRRPFSSIFSWEKFQRPEKEIYPLKKSREYSYFEMKNHDHKYSEFSPDVWGWDRIGNFRGLAVSAKSPSKGIYISRRFGKEMDKEVDLAISNLRPGDKVLEIMPYGGSYTSKILQKTKGKNIDLHIVDLSKYNINFILDRLKQEGERPEDVKAKIFSKGKIDFPDNYFDAVFLLQTAEGVPDRNIFFQEIHRILRPGGEIILSVRNMLSWFGLYFWKIIRTNQVPNFGPYIPLNPFRLISTLAKMFEIKEEKGISFLPSSIGEETNNIILKKFSRLLFLRGKKK